MESPDVEPLGSTILTVRGQKVILDAALAALYGVSLKRLNKQVRRNPARFPDNFLFSLSNQEVALLRSHFATASWGGRRTRPRVFTEHGALMAANVLDSPRAIEASIYVVRAFVKLREIAGAHKELGAKLDDLERRLTSHYKAIGEII